MSGGNKRTTLPGGHRSLNENHHVGSDSGMLEGECRAGKMVIVISHDDRYFEVGDRIIRLESRKVVSVADAVPQQLGHCSSRVSPPAN